MSNRRRENKNLIKAANKKRNRSRKIGIILADIQLIFTFIFLGLLILLNILPFKYLIAIIIVLAFFVIYAFLSQLTKNYRTLGKIISVIVSITLAFGSYYIIETRSMISDISGAETKKDEMSMVVLKDDPAETINQALDYVFGINVSVDREKSDEVIDSLNEEFETQISTNTYSGYGELVNALYSGASQVIIINEASREVINELYPNFDEETRILHNYEVVTAIPTPKANDSDVTKESFNVYISGIDVSGSISRTGRSDVNILGTINPNTNQVLLTTTPRDYFIPFPNTGGQRDKLTHAGIYGVDVSMGALEDLYGIEIDYYVRVNFDTLIGLVDALEGISVYSEYTFNAGGYSFYEGYNDMDGEKALVFSRERSSFGLGDVQRGRNQMEVIKGIINKALTPTIIVKYSSVMNSIAGSFETNMSDDAITDLIKMQIDEMSPWNIVSNNVMGKGSMEYTYTQGQSTRYSVLIPDEESVRQARQKIYAVENGEILVQE